MSVVADPVIVDEISGVFRRHRLPLEAQQAETLAVYLSMLEAWND